MIVSQRFEPGSVLARIARPAPYWPNQSTRIGGNGISTRGPVGLKVSEICLGTMTFGNGTDQAEAGRILSLSLDAGVNFIDTANTYSDGASETMLGELLGTRRHEIVLATKVFNPTGTGPNDGGMSRLHIMQAIEASLRRLRTDYIDLYYIHHVDMQTPLDEMLRALDDLITAGKIRYAACSNYEAWRLMEALWISDTQHLARFVCYQPQYSLVVRDIEEEIVPVCELQRTGRGGVVAARRRVSQPASTTRRDQPGGRALGGRLGVPDPLLRCQPRRHPGDAAAGGRGDWAVAGASGGAMGAGPALHHQRDRRGAHHRAVA